MFEKRPKRRVGRLSKRSLNRSDEGIGMSSEQLNEAVIQSFNRYMDSDSYFKSVVDRMEHKVSCLHFWWLSQFSRFSLISIKTSKKWSNGIRIRTGLRISRKTWMRSTKRSNKRSIQSVQAVLLTTAKVCYPHYKHMSGITSWDQMLNHFLSHNYSFCRKNWWNGIFWSK